MNEWAIAKSDNLKFGLDGSLWESETIAAVVREYESRVERLLNNLPIRWQTHTAVGGRGTLYLYLMVNTHGTNKQIREGGNSGEVDF